ncbi:MAG: hypothetical protein K1X89_04040 [Myxococcaceae bacterium]|nr:hypothetical protein [Myxococcaceae bacterium]
MNDFSKVVGLCVVGFVSVGCGTSLEPAGVGTDVAALADPCNAYEGDPAGCEAHPTGVCGYVTAPGFSQCVSVFAMVDDEDARNAKRWVVGERVVTAAQLREAPLTAEERLLAKANKASIVESMTPHEQSASTETEQHTSTYCGHGTSGTACWLLCYPGWCTTLKTQDNVYCGTQHCHNHRYYDAYIPCTGTAKTHYATRVCGTW